MTTITPPLPIPQTQQPTQITVAQPVTSIPQTQEAIKTAHNTEKTNPDPKRQRKQDKKNKKEEDIQHIDVEI